MQRTTVLSLLVLLTVLSPALWAEDATAEEKQPLTVGGYRLSGAASVGYRLVHIDSGREALYREVINADEGVRLFDFTLRGERTDTAPALLDRFHIEMVNIGDPSPRMRLTAAKDEVYKFSASFRQSEFFVARTDEALSSNRHFDLTRRFGDINLTLLLLKPLQVHLFFHGVERDGHAMVPRPIENNVFVLRDGLDETTYEFGAALELATRAINVRLEQTYRRFDDTGLVVLPAPGLRGLRTDPPFSTMRLDAFRETRDHEVGTLLTRLRLRLPLSPRWEGTGGYVLAHSSGTAQLQDTERGVGRAGTSGPNEDFTAVRRGSGNMSSDVHIVELGTSFALLSNLILHFDYRFHLLDEDNRGFLSTQRTGVLTGLTTLSAAGSQLMKTQAHTLTPAVEFLPLPTLTLRVGYRYQLRDVTVQQRADGLPLRDDPLAAAPHLTRDTQSHGVVVSADWRYRSLLQASMRFAGDYFDDPYTRISPTREQRVRAQVRLSPTPWLSVSETYTVADITNPDTATATQSQSWTTGLFVQPLTQLTLEGSITYEKLDHHSDTLVSNNGIRTPTTFTNDSEALNYTVAGRLDLTADFRARAYATWSRVRGEGKSSSLFPGGEVSYRWEKPALRLTVRYERPYVIEREPPFDRFFAHVATFIVTKEF